MLLCFFKHPCEALMIVPMLYPLCGAADARRAREAAEDEDLAAAAARELRRFDSELDERERRRQVRGPPWAAG